VISFYFISFPGHQCPPLFFFVERTPNGVMTLHYTVDNGTAKPDRYHTTTLNIAATILLFIAVS
jgi:hypothetical protein